jgi:hypothetical protein
MKVHIRVQERTLEARIRSRSRLQKRIRRRSRLQKRIRIRATRRAGG